MYMYAICLEASIVYMSVPHLRVNVCQCVCNTMHTCVYLCESVYVYVLHILIVWFPNHKGVVFILPYAHVYVRMICVCVCDICTYTWFKHQSGIDLLTTSYSPHYTQIYIQSVAYTCIQISERPNEVQLWPPSVPYTSTTFGSLTKIYKHTLT